MTTSLSTLFDNQPELLSPAETASLLRISKLTVYDWKARPNRYGIPEGLFLPIGRSLRVRREVLKTWVISRSS